MTDPLSVTAALVGLTATSLHLTHKLVTFTKNTHDAPKQAQTVLAEVRDLQGIISHCKELILDTGTSSSKSVGASMVLVDHVVVVLSGCVLTFSELEELLGKLNVEGEMDVLDCAKWARKEGKITVMVGRLQNHKASLTAMLAVLACSNQVEAKQSMDRLNISMEQLVTAHRDLFQRIDKIELRQDIEYPDRPFSGLREDLLSDPMASDLPLIESSATDAKEAAAFDLQLETALQEDLASSRVYRRALNDSDQISPVSGVTRATPWSLLSGWSLTDVSAISIVALPIFSSLITNSQHYDFAGSTLLADEINDKHDSDVDTSAERINRYLHLGSPQALSYWTAKIPDLDKKIWSARFCIIVQTLLSPLDPESTTTWPSSPRIIGARGSQSLRRDLERLSDQTRAILEKLCQI